MLLDSLLKLRSLDTSYYLEFSAPYNNTVRFLYIDTPNFRRGEYINIDFNLSKKQQNFFIATATDKITYLKQFNSFLLKPFYFKNGDKTLLVVINKNKGQNGPVYETSGVKIFQDGNYTYYVSDAWE